MDVETIRSKGSKIQSRNKRGRVKIDLYWYQAKQYLILIIDGQMPLSFVLDDEILFDLLKGKQVSLNEYLRIWFEKETLYVHLPSYSSNAPVKIVFTPRDKILSRIYTPFVELGLLSFADEVVYLSDIKVNRSSYVNRALLYIYRYQNNIHYVLKPTGSMQDVVFTGSFLNLVKGSSLVVSDDLEIVRRQNNTYMFISLGKRYGFLRQTLREMHKKFYKLKDDLAKGKKDG